MTRETHSGKPFTNYRKSITLRQVVPRKGVTVIKFAHTSSWIVGSPYSISARPSDSCVTSWHQDRKVVIAQHILQMYKHILYDVEFHVLTNREDEKGRQIQLRNCFERPRARALRHLLHFLTRMTDHKQRRVFRSKSVDGNGGIARSISANKKKNMKVAIDLPQLMHISGSITATTCCLLFRSL